jgi:hypothetical protein
MTLVGTLRFGKRALATHIKREVARPAPSALVADWLSTLARDGICIVPDFIDAGACARMREEFLALFDSYPSAIHKVATGADWRIFGAERASPAVREFAAHARLMEAAECSLGLGAKNAFTMANRIRAEAGNLGSGSGWHRDSFFDQFKAILYLTDVTEENGPFEFLLGSHRMRKKLEDRLAYRMPLHTPRVTEESVAALIAREPERRRVALGSAGTLVLADTTGIHRGRPLVAGERIALTNYYYPARGLSERTFHHFRPVLGHHIAIADV